MIEQDAKTKNFIEKAKIIHGDKYDYSKVEYINATTHVIIICKTHKEFKQIPYSHLNKRHGCQKCANMSINNLQRYNNETIIQKMKETHGDKYDYSKVEYINYNTNVIIICKTHNEFKQTPHYHISGGGCSKCSRKYSPSTDEFIEKAKIIHGNKYDYSKVEYINAYSNVIIMCKTHNEFKQTPHHHIQGKGCNKCSGNYSPSTDEFIEKAKKIHGDKYDYSKVEYKNNHTKITIICKTHREFEQTPGSHLHGCGCPFCINKTETKLYETMKQKFPNLISQFKKEWCKKIQYLPFDFCIPEVKIIIELDGPQHFRNVWCWSLPEEQFENDKFKEECANNNGYSVIRLLQEDVMNDTYDWVKELCDAIEQIKSSNEITNIYLSKNNEYDNF
jgi:very-short-patch-repair endonuclease/ribosomal protein L36